MHLSVGDLTRINAKYEYTPPFHSSSKQMRLQSLAILLPAVTGSLAFTIEVVNPNEVTQCEPVSIFLHLTDPPH